MPGRHEQIIALRRRFRMVDARQFLEENNLVLCTPQEVEMAKRTGLWDDFKYKCLFKERQYINDKDYHWLKADLVNTPSTDGP